MWDGVSSDEAHDLAVVASGNVYVTGYTYSWVSSQDIWVGKFSAAGALLWNFTWGGADYDEGFGITVDDAGNIYICGTTKSWSAGANDILVAKFDSARTRIWNKTWGGALEDIGWDLALDGIGNVFVCGSAASWFYGGSDIWLGKYDATSGVEQGITTWKGVSSDHARDICLDGSGSIYVTGYTYSWNIGVRGNLTRGTFLSIFSSFHFFQFYYFFPL